MRLSFPIHVMHQGDEFTATVTPSNQNGNIIYDVNDGVNLFALTPQSTKGDHVEWVNLMGETDDLIRAIGKAIERVKV